MLLLAVWLTLQEESQSPKILKPHTKYTLAQQSPKQIRQIIREKIDQAHVPSSQTPPSVLVVPGWTHDKDADRGLAASLRLIRDNIDQYDTVVVVGGFFPDQCGMVPPSTPISAYWGDEVETALGNFEIDKELREKIGRSTGQRSQSKITDELVEESDFYDQPFLWLRSLFPDNKKPRTKVLPLLLYATLRDQVQFTAAVLNDNLFKPAENSSYGTAADGKRYLVIIPIKVSEGLALYQNCYIENILLDLTFKNKVQDFEQWLYYLTGNTGATFSNTIASQILVVRLSALADKAVPHTKDTDPEWKWRMLDYYTTFDTLMNRSKMIDQGYRELDDDQFSEEEDNPSGHQIYYSMSLSLEPPLHESTVEQKGKKATSKMFHAIENPLPFSKGAMEELMLAAQLSIQGKKYVKQDQYKKYQRELEQRAPYKIRVYVLAEHKYEAKNVFERGKKQVDQQELPDSISTCQENILFEVNDTSFNPEQSVLESIIEVGQRLYEEKMSESMLTRFTRELTKKHNELVKQGKLPKSQLKDLNLNLQDNLVVELQVYHSWEYKNLFNLTEARGSFINLWDGRVAICDVPDSKPTQPSIIFFRLTQCCLKNNMDPWDWQRGVVHVFDRTRLTRPVYQVRRKDEL